MRFFIDECISPTLSRYLNQDGLHDAIHPRDRGRLGEPDHLVFARAIEEDRIIVTEDEDGFRKFASNADIHPGLIILPSIARDTAQRLMGLVIAHLTDLDDKQTQDLLVNSVLVITPEGEIRIDPLP